MTSGLHPDLDRLILYCMDAPEAGTPQAADREHVRSHVKECVECHEQLSRLRADLAWVGMTVPQIAPPAAAKDRLFQAAGFNLAELEKTAVSHGTPSIQKTPTAPSAKNNVLAMKAKRPSPALVWGGWLAAAACLFYAVQLREANRGMHRQLRIQTAAIVQSQTSAARAEKVLDVLSSPQAQRVTLVAAHARPEPAGHAVYLANRGALVFTASNLAPLPANKTYELWVIPANGTAPVPAGTFAPDARGAASLLLPRLPRGIRAKAFGVTMENSGGSKTPTLPILLAGG